MALKVLWVTGNFFPQIGGLEVYIERAVSNLADLCSIGLVTQHNQRPPEDPQITHFGIANLSRPATTSDWEAARDELAACVHEFAPDVVHFANAGVAVYRDAIPEDIATVATVHGNDLTAPWQWVPGRNVTDCMVEALSRCHRVFAVSGHTAELILHLKISAPITVVTAGCDLDFFEPIDGAGEQVRREYGIPDNQPIVLTVGRLVPRKGHHYILQAIADLPSPAHWIVVGDGPLKKSLVDAVKESGISHRVTLAGHVSDAQLKLLYNACDVFVLVPEERRYETFVDSEGFGLVFQEAAACGKAVIGSDISGCRDAVIDGATGLLVPPRNPAELARAIHHVLSDQDLATRLGACGMTLVRAAGGWPRFAQQMVEHYEDVLSASA
jgi:phosphatidylinositol alpha-1,6-mannosyltransferase